MKWLGRKWLGTWFLVGGLLWAVTVVTEGFLAPARWEPMGRLAYRTAYLVRLPVISILDPVFRIPGHHRRLPAVFQFLTAFGAPLFWAGGVWGCGVMVRRWDEWRRRPGATPSRDEGRRRFLRFSGGAGVLGVGLTSYATLVEPQRTQVRRFTAPIRNLPPSLEGLRIVQVSDTHYGPFISLEYLRSVIRQANALAADLIVLTGDYVHRTPAAIRPGVGVLKELQARLGVVGVLGNHDHWEGAQAVRDAFAQAGIPLLDNRRRLLNRDSLRSEADAGEVIGICGVGDLWEDQVRFDQALGGLPDSVPRILLAHNPDTAERIPGEFRVDLMLSGHTHGGQICFPGYGAPVVPSAYGQRYAGGWCAGPRCPVIVSRGVGMAILPVRFGVPPEIGEITLTRAADLPG
ncbi:MAG: metallophosphoesterase [Verrucomicrobia bacterium]|nr:metallophosphoesterase [Verrucomicrobiota bacterium]